jgi:hypothetical protein
LGHSRRGRASSKSGNVPYAARKRQAGVCDRIKDALAAGHDAAVQMIDTSVVRVHQHGM